MILFRYVWLWTRGVEFDAVLTVGSILQQTWV